MGIPVRAIQAGFYGGHRRRAGVKFSIQDEKHFSPTWMERLDKPAPKPEPVARRQQGGQAKRQAKGQQDLPPASVEDETASEASASADLI